MARSTCPHCSNLKRRLANSDALIARQAHRLRELEEQLAAEIECAWELANDVRVHMLEFDGGQGDEASEQCPRLRTRKGA